MARVAATEDVEGLREQAAFEDEPASSSSSAGEESMQGVVEGEGVEGDIRMEEVKGEEKEGEGEKQEGERSPTPNTKEKKEMEKRKFVATVLEVHEAFDSITVLRYTQPCHLQGTCYFIY